MISAALLELGSGVPAGVSITSDPQSLPLLGIVRTPLRRDDRLELLLLAQPTRSGRDVILSVPDVLGINGETQIGLSRANRIMQAGQTDAPPAPAIGECSFCRTAVQGTRRSALVSDNPRPFGPLLHKVVLSRRHIEGLHELELEDVADAVELFHELGHQQSAELANSFDGLTIGMNFGEYLKSGASQIHFHYQVAGLGPANYNAGDALGALCRAYRRRHPLVDYLADYERALRDAGLVIVENYLALAYAPISARFKGEVQIMLRRPNAGNIMDTTAEERQALAALQLDVFQRLDRLSCRALNQVWYMTRVSAANDYGQRLIVSICPRSSIIAFYELSGHNVIDTLPWVSAKLLREAAAVA